MSAKKKNTKNSDDNNSNKALLIGEYLKLERENRGISLEYISAQTKINYNILKNLENDNLKELPNIAYLKGFVQHYVRILDGDLKTAIERLEYSYSLKKENDHNKLGSERELQVKPSVGKAIGNAHEETIGDQIVSFFDILMNNKKTIAIVGGVAIGMFGVYGAYKYINDNVAKNIETPNKKVAEQKNDIKNSDANILESEKLKQMREESIAVENKEENKEEVKVEEKKEVAKEEEKKEVAKEEEKAEEKKEVAQKEEPIKKVKPSEKFPFVKFRKIQAAKIYNIMPDAEENTDEDVFPTNYRNKLVEGKVNLFINALYDKTWLSYSIDNGNVVTRILKPGQKLFIQGDEVAVFMGNINATKVFYNNKLVDPQSKTGVKSLIFPESKIRDYYLPLFKANTDGVLYKSKEYISRMQPKEEESQTN